MITQQSLRVLAFLVHNINDGVETIEEARDFVQHLDGLSEYETLFLEAALCDAEQVATLEKQLVAGRLKRPRVAKTVAVR